MNKVHDEIESLTDVYLAGGLDDDEHCEVESHASTCQTCAAVLRDAEEFHGWVKGSSVATAPPVGLEDRIISNLRRSTIRRSPKLIKTLIGLAAVVAVVIIGNLFSGSSEEVGMLQRMTFAHRNTQSQFSPVDPNVPPSNVVFGLSYEGYTDEYRSKDLDRNYKGDLERARQGVTDAIGVGGGGGSGGRYGGKPGGEALKNEVEKSTKSAEGRRFADAGAEESGEKDAWADKKAGDELRKNLEDQNKRPEAPAPPVVDDRKIIRNADLHLEVEAYDKAYPAIVEITRAKQGFVAGASTTRLANGKIKATITLRIPPEKFEETIAELGKLGTERHRNLSTSDVTKQYTDLASRLKSKETLVERLKKVLLEGKGTVKELMEVEVQMGATIEQIEVIKGELKYYDNLVGMSTITLQVFEKDLGLPFEYVQTLQSVITVRAFDVDAKYAQAQKVILDAGGQVVQSQLSRTNEEQASGFVRGKVDADKFPDVRAKLKALGEYIDQDTVNQQQTGRGGQGDSNPGAKIKKEQAVIDFTVNTPPIRMTRQAALSIEVSPADAAYQQARQEVTAAGGEIVAGSLMDKTDGASAFVKAQIREDKFAALVEKLKSLGKVKNATVKQDEPGSDTGRAQLLLKKGEIVLEISSPPPLIPEDSGVGKVIRETFTRSIAGLLWSFEKLFVGIALAGPWIVLALVVLLIWRAARRRAKRTEASGPPA